jgi:enamine deaminase RidA (YjgF/YER057c/UK114 family)
MATKTIIKPAKSPAAVGPYNHAVRAGDLLFCAGQIPIDPATGNLISGDIKAQTERTLQNVKASDSRSCLHREARVVERAASIGPALSNNSARLRERFLLWSP